MDLNTLLILLSIGLLAGVVSGFVGIGGGMIIVPALVYFLGMSQHGAQGTSLAMMLPPIGVLAVMSYAQEGAWNWKYAAVLAATFVIGAYFGSKWTLKLSPVLVKFVFACFMLLAAVRMGWKAAMDLWWNG
jgi:uncharacterized membrane protein YfcA